MQDDFDIFAGISYEIPNQIPDHVQVSIFVDGREVSRANLLKDIAIELHRRINRIPEDAPTECPDISRCAVCNATAEEAPPGLRKNKVGAYICYDNKACIDRMWAAGQTQASADEMYHRQHCAACRAIEGHTPSLIEWAARESARYVVDRWVKGDF